MPHGFLPNGGGSLVNQYTLIMDIWVDSKPMGRVGLLQTDEDNAGDADWFASGNGVGIDESYGGVVSNRAWYRIALVIDAVAGTMTSYIDGSPVQTMTGVTLDGRWSLAPNALILADGGEKNASGYINSLQMRNYALTAEQIANLGSVSAAGIPIELTLPTPTNTPVPPTAAPTDTPVEGVTPEPTATPTDTPGPTNTPAPTDTPAPQRLPSPIGNSMEIWRPQQVGPLSHRARWRQLALRRSRTVIVQSTRKAPQRPA